MESVALVKFRVPATISAFWYTRNGKEVEAKAGEVIEVEERVARLYGWSPEAVQREADELQQRASEAQVLAASAKAAADAAARHAAEVKADGRGGRR